MAELIELNSKCSTTHQVTYDKPVIVKCKKNKYKSVLFLPENIGRKGEGGLRTNGYFKQNHPKKPLITVITVVYNDEQFLEDTILSVINQTYENVEYIIIDGSSNDGTLDTIRKYEHAIDYWVSEKDDGIYDAMNKGIEAATGEWIIFLNSGDTLINEKVFSSIFDGDVKLDEFEIIFGKSLTQYENYKCIRYSNFSSEKSDFYLKKMPNHQAILVRKSVYKNYKYNLSYKYLADTEYLRRVFKKSNYYEYSGVISKFNLGGVSNFYNNFKTLKKLIGEHQKLGRGFLKPILIHSTKFFLQKVLGKDMYLKIYIKYLVKK